jgi:hypothetical protein
MALHWRIRADPLVHLWRQDTVAQAVSWARAEQTQFGQEGDTPLAGQVPHFDFAQIHSGLDRAYAGHSPARCITRGQVRAFRPRCDMPPSSMD